MKISIVTVVFNGASFLDACICSVLAQDYPHLEYIIIDGGSQDGSIAIAQYYQHRLAYYVSVPDCGIYDAFNKGIAVSTGEIVGMLNADDRLTDAGVITRQVALIDPQHIGPALTAGQGLEGMAAAAGPELHAVVERAVLKELKTCQKLGMLSPSPAPQ